MSGWPFSVLLALCQFRFQKKFIRLRDLVNSLCRKADSISRQLHRENRQLTSLGDLSADMASKLKQFLSVRGMASSIHHVKHYFELQNDEAFPVGQVPDCVKVAALRGDVTRRGIQSSLEAAFPFVDPGHFEIDRDKITFHLLKKEPWTAYQVKFVELMLSEIIPAGTAASLSVE